MTDEELYDSSMADLRDHVRSIEAERDEARRQRDALLCLLVLAEESEDDELPEDHPTGLSPTGRWVVLPTEDIRVSEDRVFGSWAEAAAAVYAEAGLTGVPEGG